MKRYWLSIDWDYFCREALAWDWGHRESPFFRDAVWGLRAMGLQAAGLDVLKETGVQHADPHPALFWARLEQDGLDLSRADVVVSDSHAQAYDTFTCGRPRGKVEMLHFDAHHDLGYELFEHHYGTETADCGSWLWFVLNNLPDLKVQVIFPKWKGATDWMHGNRHWWIRRIAKRVAVHVWPVTLEPGRVERIHLCRSGSWSPPWLDHHWLDLVKEAKKRCASFRAPYTKLEGTNVLRARPFDIEEIQEAMRVEVALRQALRKGGGK